MKTYLWVQLFCMLLLVSYLFGNIASIGHTNIFIYGAFIFVQVYALTEFMDRHKNAWILEAVKNVACIYWILLKGDWFGSNQLSTLIAPIAIVYFALSSIVVFYFSTGKDDKRKGRKLNKNSNSVATDTAKLFIQK
jgi:drug/metabolite transporter (DMT)-like permease